MSVAGRRPNMVGRPPERWRPPPLAPPSRTRWARATAAVRRLLDVQNGSIWRDLAPELRGVRGNVLDVGCGAQPYRPLLPPTAVYRGVDTADAGATFGYRLPDTAYFTGGGRLPVDDRWADVVLCTEVLEHVAEPQSLLGEAHRCLRPGGRLLLTVPFAARYHFIPFDYYRYTPAGLERLLRAAGFEDLEIYARGNALTVAAYKAMALVLPLLLPQGPSAGAAVVYRLAAVPLLPAFLTAAVLANLSLRGRGGDDCLGYTVLARRAQSRGSDPPPPSSA